MRIGLTLAAVALVLAVLTGLLVRGIGLDAEGFDEALAALDRFAAAHTALQRDALEARGGLLRNYDRVVRDTAALEAALAQLTAVAAGFPGTRPAVERLAAALDRQEELVERFKSDNALLQNSLAYFRLFTNQVMTSGDGGPAVRGTGVLAGAMLNLLLDTSPAAAGEVTERLDDLAAASSADGDDTVAALLAHGRLLHDVLPGIDATLKRLLQVPDAGDVQAVRTAIVTVQTAVRDSARHVWVALYGMSVVLLGLLVHLGVQLRLRAVRLRRRAAFDHLIAAVSTRFVDAGRAGIDGAIEEAVGDLARHLGAGHGYFVMESRSGALRTWHHGSAPLSPQWPRQALDVAAGLKPDAAGIVRVVAGRRPPGAGHDALAAAGIDGFVAVPPAGGAAARSMLAFHGLRNVAAAGDELGVLRMARDTIHGAVRRNVLEEARRRLQQRLDQARRLETVGALASGIAHNFNNIVGAIVGHAEFAEAQLQPGQALAAGNLDAIRRASERARDLIDCILMFGRNREGLRRPLDAAAVIAEAGSLLRASLPGTVDLVLPRHRPVLVSGEPAQLQQVIINLCTNAAQAMDNAGPVTVTAEVCDVAAARRLSHGALAGGRYLQVGVSDTGRGIDAAMLDRIFEPFFTTRADGNGLGLATVREIVEDHGGAIHVCSRPGAGSRFEVWLPCAPEPARGRPHLPDAVTAAAGRGETVLIVEDDADRLLRDEEIVAALGYEPVGVATAAAALAACRAQPQRFDAVVVVLHADAAAVLELAAALQVAAPAVPVVVAVWSAVDILADELAGAGVAGIIHRPLNSAELAAALQRALAAGHDWGVGGLGGAVAPPP